MNASQAGVAAASAPQEASGADFYFSHHGSVAVLVPISEDAQAWVDDNLPADAMHYAGGVILEARMVPAVLGGIVVDGFKVTHG